MRIVSWNCHYGLNETKAESLLDKFRETDIFVIQECKRTDIDSFKRAWKFKNWYGDDLEYSDLGIAVFSNTCKIEFTDEFCRHFRYVVPYKVTKNEKHFTLFAVWTKPVPFYYDENVGKAMCSSEYKNLVNGDVIILGDFNTAYNEEHKERYSKLKEKLKGFKNCTAGTDEEFKTTFYSDREQKLFLNDFCFVSDKFNTKNITVEVKDEWEVNAYGQKRWHDSDHCPIIVDFDF